MKTLFTLSIVLIISAQAYSQECDSLHSPCLGTFSRNGFYFDLEAVSDVTVNGISYLVQNPGTRDISLYYRQGTYFGFEGVASNWTYLGTDSAVTPDNALSCPIPHQPAVIDFTVCIPQGQRYGFYLVMSSGTGTLESHSNLIEGSIGAQDAYLKLITGKGQFGIGDFAGTLTPDLTFQGAIHYFCLCVTSSEENKIEKEIIAYPNPVLNQLAVSNGQLTIKNMEIYDMPGQRIFLSPPSSALRPQCIIDVSGLSKGFYLLKIYTEDGIRTMKFIKE
ncbi:MAG TPA: T9SS type A sorting domain-containing protein [Bacteroidia bacterium]|nr:T9SS type A sorting domain-containing protein [Bacteroidia bacterium]